MKEISIKYILLVVALISLFILAGSPLIAFAIKPVNNYSMFGNGAIVINLNQSDPSIFHMIQAISVCHKIQDFCVDQSSVAIMPIFKKIQIINKSKPSQQIIINDNHDFGLINTATIKFEVENTFFEKLAKQLRISEEQVEIILSLDDRRSEILEFSFPNNGYESTQDFFYTIKPK